MGKERYVITAGKVYLDIDAYGAGIAYRELMRGTGREAICVAGKAKPNESVAPVILEIGLELDQDDGEGGKYVILDVSNPEIVDEEIGLENIVEVMDHHTGFEEFWAERKGTKVQIEFIGSVCTMVFERYVECGRTDLLTRDICKLLVAGILDNTLNLKAGITTERDLVAYEKLLEIGELDESWGEEYFRSCQGVIEEDLAGAILSGVKVERVSEVLPEVIGQLLVLDAEGILRRRGEVAEVLGGIGEGWMINVISLREGKSYILAADGAKEGLEKLFRREFVGEELVLPRFMLRKEIIKRAREF